MASAVMISREREGTTLAMHCFAPDEPRAVLFYVHGIQSHGGWLFETGPQLAAQGIALYVLDRRGCGRSTGPRGDTPSFEHWIDDYVAAFEDVRRAHPSLPIALLGTSMGGTIATAVACSQRTDHAGLILTTPALSMQRVRFSAEERERIANDASDESFRVPILDEQYTDDPRYLAFIGADESMTRFITKRHRAAQVRMEDYYLSRLHLAPRVPSLLVLASEDPTLKNDAARATFRELAPDEGVIVEFPMKTHYVEFSRWRDAYVSQLAQFLQVLGA